MLTPPSTMWSQYQAFQGNIGIYSRFPNVCTILIKSIFQLSSQSLFCQRLYIFKGPNNVIGLYWRLKFEQEQFCVEITQPLDFVMIFFGQVVDLQFMFCFQTCLTRVFSNPHNSHTNTSNSKKLAGKQPNYFVWTFINIKFLVKQTLIFIQQCVVYGNMLFPSIERRDVIFYLIHTITNKYLYVNSEHHHPFFPWVSFSTKYRDVAF